MPPVCSSPCPEHDLPGVAHAQMPEAAEPRLAAAPAAAGQVQGIRPNTCTLLAAPCASCSSCPAVGPMAAAWSALSRQRLAGLALQGSELRRQVHAAGVVRPGLRHAAHAVRQRVQRTARLAAAHGLPALPGRADAAPCTAEGKSFRDKSVLGIVRISSAKRQGFHRATLLRTLQRPHVPVLSEPADCDPPLQDLTSQSRQRPLMGARQVWMRQW